MTWFHFHKWYPVATKDYVDTSYDRRVPSCMVISRCLTCGELKKTHFYGSGPLNLVDLQNAPTKFTMPSSSNISGYQPTTSEVKSFMPPPKKP